MTMAIDQLLTLIAIIILLGLLKQAGVAIKAAQRTDWDSTWLNYLDGLNRLFCQHYHRLQYTPVDLPTQGPALIVANHLSGLDSLLLVAVTQRPLRFLIAREQYERFGLTWLFRAMGCIPVDRSRHPEVALRAALRALESGEVIALFPQGTFTLPGEKRKLKGGIFWLAEQTNSPIYPVFISGIKGIGHIFRGVLWPSHAKMITYPPLEWNRNNSLESLQTILEGRET